MPEIGLTGLPLDYPHSGTAVYTRNLVPLIPEAAPDLSFCLYTRSNQLAEASLPMVELKTPFSFVNQRRSIGARVDKLAWEVVAVPVAAAIRGDTLLHFLYLAAPPLLSTRLIVTIHDLIPLVVPGYHRSRQSALYSRFMAWTARRADAIITVSEHSKQDIMRVLHVPDSRVRVIYEAVDERFVARGEANEGVDIREKYGLPQCFLLYIGGAERRKNLRTLTQAWALVAEHMRRRGVGLVVVADFPPPDGLYPDIRGLAKHLEIDQDLHFVPRVDECDKPALYRAALAFCFPSDYEGFGFTPLEAMACGLPVLVADATSLPEVVGDAGLRLPPHSAGAWADAMQYLVDSAAARTALRERGLARARAFSWRRTALETVEVYRDVLDR